MVDFNKSLDLCSDIVTSYKGKELVIHNPYIYDGPITMQYLPYGGIQSVYHGKLIITTVNGFIASDSVTYDGIKMSSKEFISRHDDLVNTILPN